MQYLYVKCQQDNASCVILSFAAQVITWDFVNWENLSNVARKVAGTVKRQVCFLYLSFLEGSERKLKTSVTNNILSYICKVPFSESLFRIILWFQIVVEQGEMLGNQQENNPSQQLVN